MNIFNQAKTEQKKNAALTIRERSFNCDRSLNNAD